LPTWFILSDWGILDKLYQPVLVPFGTLGGYHVGVLSSDTLKIQKYLNLFGYNTALKVVSAKTVATTLSKDKEESEIVFGLEQVGCLS